MCPSTFELNGRPCSIWKAVMSEGLKIDTLKQRTQAGELIVLRGSCTAVYEEFLEFLPWLQESIYRLANRVQNALGRSWHSQIGDRVR